MGATNLIGDDGRAIPCREPIPGVYLHAATYDTPEKVRQKMREVFPRSHFAELWAKHPTVFEDK